MSNLTETFCFKVSKEMKQYLDDTDKSSEYVRQLILQNMRIRDTVSKISSAGVHKGEEYIEYDEEKLNELISKEVMETVMFHVFKETKIVLK